MDALHQLAQDAAHVAERLKAIARSGQTLAAQADMPSLAALAGAVHQVLQLQALAQEASTSKEKRRRFAAWLRPRKGRKP